MSKYKTKVRELLKKFPDGLTAMEIARFMELQSSTGVITALQGMGDAYIDRWVRRSTGQLAAVWCLADVPEDCPRPDVTERHARKVALRLTDAEKLRIDANTKSQPAGRWCPQ